MNKRSAVFMAAGLVAVLTLGGIAFSLGLTGPTVSAASARTTSAHVQPIVRTQTKKIVVHRQAPTPPARTVFRPAPSSFTAPEMAAAGAVENYSDVGELEGDGGGGGDD